ncbi:hypothetical protein KCM76_24985 [Zooshikella marina]|uniref:hypothetical protein n=1 Tax=Zooshikella ganghwensis TaxID=202772 RepID=UPI001BB02F4E|nr:hypothetical protein [Zooshikella ganghwensis]MBU2709275.1 hypothetical protein [Zooshikella ganghwensis]
MNGFQLIGKDSFDQLSKSLKESEPYIEADGICIDIKCSTADITFIYLEQHIVSKEEALSLLSNVIALDEMVAMLKTNIDRFKEHGTEYHISYVEIESASKIALYYCGVSVNEQWGVEFQKSKSGQWVYKGYC